MINRVSYKPKQPSFGLNIKAVSLHKYLQLTKCSKAVSSGDCYGISGSGVYTMGLNTCVGLVIANKSKNFIAHIAPGIDLDKLEKNLNSYIDQCGFNHSAEAIIIGSCDKERFGKAIVDKMKEVLKARKISASELTSQKQEYSTSIYSKNRDIFICHANANKGYSVDNYLSLEASKQEELGKIYSNIKILTPRDRIYFT